MYECNKYIKGLNDETKMQSIIFNETYFSLFALFDFYITDLGGFIIDILYNIDFHDKQMLTNFLLRRFFNIFLFSSLF